MKYTEKSPEFQRSGRQVRLVIAIVFSLYFETRGQEIAWPVPSAAPEQFVGTLLQWDGFERYYDPFRSATVYAIDRRSSGTALLKFSAGQRGAVKGTQLEAEWYPILGAGTYGYVGYALGLEAPFPRHRGGIEYFTSFARTWEGSLGLRTYVFRDRRTVTLATGSLARYIGNAWLSVRPYLSVNLPRLSVSVTATGRYYFGERDEYAFVRLGAGFTPDERSTLSTSGLPATEVFTLHSQSLAGGVQWFVSKGWLLVAEGTLGRQEVGFLRGTYIWNPGISLGVRYTVR